MHFGSLGRRDHSILSRQNLAETFFVPGAGMRYQRLAQYSRPQIVFLRLLGSLSTSSSVREIHSFHLLPLVSAVRRFVDALVVGNWAYKDMQLRSDWNR